MRTDGFTLLETIVVLIVASILAGAAIQITSVAYRNSAFHARRLSDFSAITRVMEQLEAHGRYLEYTVRSPHMGDDLDKYLADLREQYDGQIRISSEYLTYQQGEAEESTDERLLRVTLETDTMKLSRVFGL